MFNLIIINQLHFKFYFILFFPFLSGFEIDHLNQFSISLLPKINNDQDMSHSRVIRKVPKRGMKCGFDPFLRESSMKSSLACRVLEPIWEVC